MTDDVSNNPQLLNTSEESVKSDDMLSAVEWAAHDLVVAREATITATVTISRLYAHLKMAEAKATAAEEKAAAWDDLYEESGDPAFGLRPRMDELLEKHRS